MKAKCYCKKHGRLTIDDIVIKDHTPLCYRCHSVLEFCIVKPRFNVNGGTKKVKKRRRKKRRKRRKRSK